MRTMRKRSLLFFIFILVFLCIATAGLYNLPPVHDRAAWRIESLRTRLRYALNPPQQVIFVPQEQEQIAEIVNATMQALLPKATETPQPSPTATPTQPGPTATPLPTPTPTLTPTPLPEKVVLTGIRHEYQQMNNCGPTTLAMALSFWGWQGDQRDTRAYLRPNFVNIDDKNVNPFEMVNYVETQTGLKALTRVGGDLDLLKRFLAAGFPVIVEKGLQQHAGDWMGHYALINGYDDVRQRFISQDSYIMPNLPVPYADLADRWWRDFNYVYLVVYPPEREAEVLAILGLQADETANYQHAAALAEEETQSLSGRDLFFAWYNLGSSRTGLSDYAGAAQAYDQAFALYPTIPEEDRPWRMLWYQVGPYVAYYNTGRYQDVIRLGNQTLDLVGKPVLEESYYWLGRAREAQGDLEKAIYDYEKAVEINPISTPAKDELKRLGISYP